MNGIHGPDFSMIQGICPAGWHVPTDKEWKTLEMYLGMSLVEANKIEEWRGTDEGGKLKETWIKHWVWPNSGATNESGFTALPGGGRSYEGFSYWIQLEGRWWTATPYGGTGNVKYVYRGLEWGNPRIYRDLTDRGFAFSVRCLKN
jgi:uncharacterized protein (TIGR02145 family)